MSGRFVFHMDLAPYLEGREMSAATLESIMDFLIFCPKGPTSATTATIPCEVPSSKRQRIQ